MNIKKICLVTEEKVSAITESQVRGGMLFVYYFIKELEKRNIAPILITSNITVNARIAFKRTKVYSVFPFIKNNFFRAINSFMIMPIKLIGIFKKEKPDIIIAKTAGTYFPSIIAGKICGIQVKAHVGALAVHKSEKLIERLLLSLPYDQILVVGKHIENEVKKISKRNVLNIENAADYSIFKPLNKKFCRKKLTIPPDKKVLLYAGGLVEVKGLQNLLRIFKALDAKYPQQYLLIILGDGPEKIKLKEISKKMKIHKSVLFRNGVDYFKMPQYYSAADVFVLTSKSEGLPRTILESTACGTPVISYPCGEAKYLPGAVITANNEQEYINKIISVVQRKKTTFKRYEWSNLVEKSICGK